MNKKKKLFLIIISSVLVIQFVPTRNNKGEVKGNNDINHTVNVPADVDALLARACYDCHSNKTNYKWYCYIQPIGIWIEHHVNEGKDELNFSEFKTYKLKRASHKLKECIEMIEEKEMPINSYLIVHEEAKLSSEEAKKLIDWAKANKISLDSLIY